jgi:hypothetical protein
MLTANADAASAQRQEHGMCRHGRMPYERSFLTGIEEAQLDVVIHRIGSEHEGNLSVREFTRDRS